MSTGGGEALSAARDRAVRLLARREHSRRELERKLGARSLAESAIKQALDDLEAEGLLDDERFTEAYIRQRVSRGYGPLRIGQELRQRGVDDALANRQLAALDLDWRAQAEQVRARRFGGERPADFDQRARQLRFLEQRGFPLSDL